MPKHVSRNAEKNIYIHTRVSNGTANKVTTEMPKIANIHVSWWGITRSNVILVLFCINVVDPMPP